MADPNDHLPLIAMVALNSPVLPKQKPLVTELRRRLEMPSVASDLEKTERVLSFQLGDDIAAIALAPAPIPWSELEGPCATAWWWPEATERMRTHQYHLLVTLIGGSGTPLERHILLTHLTAAVLASVEAVGVYWSLGTLVHEPKLFQEYSEGLSPAEVVPQLWIDMRVVQNDDGTFGYFTTGLEPLGHLEIEIDRSARAAEEIMDFCHDIISYIITSGATINEGETIGRSEDEHIAVTHGESQFGRGTVMKLEY